MNLKRNKSAPPKWIDQLLKVLCAPDLLEEILGDMHERYDIRAKRNGTNFQSQLSYLREACSYLRPRFILRKRTIGNFGGWDGGGMHGKIGILGNGAGSVMATLDLVVSSGGKPGVCLNLRHAFLTDTTPTTFNTRLEKALQILTADKSIQVILINFLGGIPQAEEVAEVIANFIQEQPNNSLPGFVTNGSRNGRKGFSIPKLVIRLAGSNLDIAKKYLSDIENLAQNSVLLVESLDEAVAQAVKLTKAKAKK